MTFIPAPETTSGKVEDLFVLNQADNAAFLVAILKDDTRLFLSDGPARNWPRPWPLWYEPYTIEDPGSVAWLERRRERFFQVQAEVRQGFELQHKRGLGVYVTIEGLEVGETPRLVHKIADNASPRLLEKAHYHFSSAIKEFVPVSSREEGQTLTPP